MSGELAKAKCEACRADAPKIPSENYAEYLRALPGWQIVKRDDVDILRRVFKTADFAAAMELANRIGELAEGEGHHPALLVEWGKLTVDWWTHKIGGLHLNDFIMAAKTECLDI